MLNSVYFNKIGYLESKIPNDLLLSLQKEALNAPTHNQEIISGLSGNGVPKHLRVMENRIALEQYVKTLIPQFEKEFNYFESAVGCLFDTVPPIRLGNAWFNFQQRYEFIPVHRHSGIYSFIIWLNIPYNIKKELSSGKYASCLSFLFTTKLGDIHTEVLPVSKDWVGKILLFSSRLHHTVYPFYTSTGTRISLSGNINFLNNAI